MTILRLATRNSPLALRQASIASEAIKKTAPEIQIELVPMTSEGDTIEGDLASAGGKDLFATTLRRAMRGGEANAACHSLKDLGRQPDDLVLAAFLSRSDPRDCLVGKSRGELEAIASPSIGSSSPRRAAQFTAAIPDASIVPIRGNIATRLGKLENGACDSLVLACAGLERLGMSKLIRSRLPVDEFVPAPGQGIIALECGKNDKELIELLGKANDPVAHQEAQAERACAEELNGDCHTPLGAHARTQGAEVKLLCSLAHGGNSAFATVNGADPLQTGVAAARKLLAAGGKEILEQIRN